MVTQTTFQVNITQRTRRLANVRITVKSDVTEIDGLAFGNESAVPLALGLLLYAARSFSVEGDIRAGIDLAIQAYDPDVNLNMVVPSPTPSSSPGVDWDDIPF